MTVGAVILLVILLCFRRKPRQKKSRFGGLRRPPY